MGSETLNFNSWALDVPITQGSSGIAFSKKEPATFLIYCFDDHCKSVLESFYDSCLNFFTQIDHPISFVVYTSSKAGTQMEKLVKYNKKSIVQFNVVSLRSFGVLNWESFLEKSETVPQVNAIKNSNKGFKLPSFVLWEPETFFRVFNESLFLFGNGTIFSNSFFFKPHRGSRMFLPFAVLGSQELVVLESSLKANFKEWCEALSIDYNQLNFGKIETMEEFKCYFYKELTMNSIALQTVYSGALFSSERPVVFGNDYVFDRKTEEMAIYSSNLYENFEKKETDFYWVVPSEQDFFEDSMLFQYMFVSEERQEMIRKTQAGSFGVSADFTRFLEAIDSVRNKSWPLEQNAFLPESKQRSPGLVYPFFTKENYIYYLFSSHVLLDLPRRTLATLELSIASLFVSSRHLFKKYDGLSLFPDVNLCVVCVHFGCEERVTSFFLGFHTPIEEKQYQNAQMVLNIYTWNEISIPQVDFFGVPINLIALKNAKDQQLKPGAHKFVTPFTSDSLLENSIFVPSMFFDFPFEFLNALLENENHSLLTNLLLYQDTSNVTVLTVDPRSSSFTPLTFFTQSLDALSYEFLLKDVEFDCIQGLHVYSNQYKFMEAVDKCKELQLLTHNAFCHKTILEQEKTRTRIILFPYASHLEENEDTRLKMTMESIRIYEETKFRFDLGKMEEWKFMSNPDLLDFVQNGAEVEFRRKTGQIFKEKGVENVKNAIVTFGTNYQKYQNELLVFLKTARMFHSPEKVDIVLFTDDDKIAEVSDVFRDYNVSVFPFWSYIKIKHPDLDSNDFWMSHRLLVLWEHFKDKPGVYKNIFLTDAADLIFQGDFFSLFPDNGNYSQEPILFTNYLDGVATNSRKNFRANALDKEFKQIDELNPLFGFVGFSFVYGAPRTCAGTIAGDLASILSMSLFIIDMPEKYNAYRHYDQEILIFLVEKWKSVIPIQSIPNGLYFFRIQIKDEENGVVVVPNCFFLELVEKPDKPFAHLKYLDHDPPPIIHQIDYFQKQNRLNQKCVETWNEFLKKTQLNQLIPLAKTEYPNVIDQLEVTFKGSQSLSWKKTVQGAWLKLKGWFIFVFYWLRTIWEKISRIST